MHVLLQRRARKRCKPNIGRPAAAAAAPRRENFIRSYTFFDRN
jgi:hypothetical protein